MTGNAGGCSSKNCTVAPRCPDCQHNFVGKAGEFCNECEAKSCEICREKTKVYYAFKAEKTSKYQGILNVCLECYKTVCRECGVKSYTLDENHICDHCDAKAEWSKASTGRYPSDHCINCTEEKFLNEEGLCETCFIARNTTTNRHRCLECKTMFESHSPQEWLCETCKPICLGCSFQFNPVERTDTLCHSCLVIANTANNCANCGNWDELNNEAHCENCKYVRTTGSRWCYLCKDVRVAEPVSVCKKCAKAAVMCPECLTSIIKASEYMCIPCMSKRGADKYYDISKRHRRRLTM